ncbi:MAG: twin-arginine translocase subunit TatC [Ardenticatenaceae bacterium]|nr:twin-arginine translocase subunit TatC [Anaerolineales bacterium]MCB8917293.1 twin-arginine translocase subunit TatC [Ardenticatenaceae bacterium]
MSEAETPEAGQTILEHLNELRQRLVWAVAALTVGTVIGFFFAPAVLEFLIAPYNNRVQAISPTEPVEIYFKLALVLGGVVAMPFILYQVWLFVAPGLQRGEKRFAFVFVSSAFALFLAGIAFAWFVLMPAALSFLRDFMPTIFDANWTAREYIGFTSTFLFWIGVSFEMPLVIYLFARAGLVSAATLREQWRLAVVIIAVLAAAVTPSIDPVTMLLAMAPLLVLYVLSIGLARLGQRQFERSMAVEA